MSPNPSSLGVRVLTALVLLPVTLILVWAPQARIGFILFIVAMAGIAAFEFFRIARILHASTPLLPGILVSLLVSVSAAWGDLTLVNTALMIAILIVSALHVNGGLLSLSSIAASVFGIIYVGWFSAHMILLHGMGDKGPGLVMVLIVAVIFTDAGAYFVGRAFGSHKLAPAISPNKTWEGAIGGFVLTVVVLAGMGWLQVRMGWTALPEWSPVRYAAVAVLLSISAQIGDLLESSMKRDAGVKDSGNAFPGHGGALDRFDGFLFAAPVLYYIAAL